MHWKHFPVVIAFCCLPALAAAQDSRSFALAGAVAGVPMGAFGIYWNPALLAIPNGSPGPWVIGSGFSAFDTSNTNSPILRFSPETSIQSSAEPVIRFQQAQGIFAVGYQNAGGGVYYDQELNYTASQGALVFFRDRDNNAVPLNSTYNLHFQQTNQQIGNLILAYSSPFPLGNFPFLSFGGNLKYHSGLLFQQTILTGTYQQLSPASGYEYTKYSSTSGYGLSFDLGFYGKVTDAFQIGVMLQNIKSDFSWTAQKSTWTLDGSGHETMSGSPQNVTLPAPFPYVTKVGVVAAPQDKDILLTVEADFISRQINWRFGLERYYPENNIVVRFGTFADNVSNSQLWIFGGGYQGPSVTANLSFLTRSLPSVQDSLAVGGAVDAGVRF